MKKLIKPNKGKTLYWKLVKVQTEISPRGSKNECTEPGGKYAGCQNPRGCGCTC